MPRLVPPVLPSGCLARLTQPHLEAGELRLRPWAVGDVDALVAAYRDPAIQHWHFRSMTSDEAEEWISSWPRRWAQETGAGWAVTRAGVVVGQVSVRAVRLAESSVDLSYWTAPEARGQNVAPRALGAVTDWLFGSLGIHRAELAHSTQNPSSCHVAEKAGFALEGIQQQRLFHADGWHDMHAHARLGPR